MPIPSCKAVRTAMVSRIQNDPLNEFVSSSVLVTLRRGIPFSAATFEVSFLSVIALLPVSVIYHLKAYVVNFQNSHIILIC